MEGNSSPRIWAAKWAHTLMVCGVLKGVIREKIKRERKQKYREREKERERRGVGWGVAFTDDILRSLKKIVILNKLLTQYLFFVYLVECMFWFCVAA